MEGTIRTWVAASRVHFDPEFLEDAQIADVVERAFLESAVEHARFEFAKALGCTVDELRLRDIDRDFFPTNDATVKNIRVVLKAELTPEQEVRYQEVVTSELAALGGPISQAPRQSC